MRQISVVVLQQLHKLNLSKNVHSDQFNLRVNFFEQFQNFCEKLLSFNFFPFHSQLLVQNIVIHK